MLELDKKSAGGAVRMALLRDIGDSFVHRVNIADLDGLLGGVEELWRM
jgi:3-dehydroquinate synthetase